MANPPDRVPITVLTGFLGSGKTTVLNQLLRQPQLAETAVIVNEFGEIGIDHLLVEAASDDVVLLDAGCLCCRIGSTLTTTLQDLWVRRVSGRIPRFRRVMLETTGLADPAPILHTLTADRAVLDHYALDGVVVTVDAVHGESQLRRHREAVRQLAVADRVVLTKTDLASAGAIASIRARIGAANPGAPLLTARAGAVAPEAVLGAGPFDLAGKSAAVDVWLRVEAAASHHHAQDPNRHDDRVRAYGFWIDAPVSWAGLAAWSALLRERYGEQLLRLKGVLRIAEEGTVIVIHAVHHVFAPPTALATWPSADPRSRVVLICSDLDRADLAATLPVLATPAGTPVSYPAQVIS